jgi:hypothetical protein
VDSKSTIFQERLKKEQEIRWKAQQDKFIKEASNPDSVISLLYVEENQACMFVKVKAMGDEFSDSCKLMDR